MSAAASAVEGKALATCKARAALLGATLHALPDDAGRSEFIVSRWHLTKSFATLAEVEAWLDRVEGKR
ncbi:hypothetical protein [Roseateles sp. LYH14W]|uniref:Uncharacterized protein n=1 Tax=Pelomonas parva TaxID=3299032 RepID=A0ABW7EZF0_9BURK